MGIAKKLNTSPSSDFKLGHTSLSTLTETQIVSLAPGLRNTKCWSDQGLLISVNHTGLEIKGQMCPKPKD